MKSAFLRSIDEPDVIVRIDLETVQDRRQVVRDLPALVFDDRTAGPVDEFQVVLDLVRSRTGIRFCLNRPPRRLQSR